MAGSNKKNVMGAWLKTFKLTLPCHPKKQKARNLRATAGPAMEDNSASEAARTRSELPRGRDATLLFFANLLGRPRRTG